jgi:hypothetical protein
MTPLESSLSDATIWSITLEVLITNLDLSFTLIFDVYSIGITYDNRRLMIFMFILQTKGLNVIRLFRAIIYVCM